MERVLRHIFILAALAAMTGCALYPAVQVAGGAMTGYDAAIIADEYLPRESVEGGERGHTADSMLERRMRERLRMNGLTTVSAHVIDRQAYLVGQFPNRAEADKSIKVASSVHGITAINCKFFPMASPREAQNDTRLLSKLVKRLGETKRLNNADLRVEVIRSNAIIVGSTPDYAQKTAALAVASEVGGIHEVVDYIVVKSPPKPEAEGDKVAKR